MELQNSSESVSSEISSAEEFRKVFDIPNEKYSYNADAICASSLTNSCYERKNYNSTICGHTTTFQYQNSLQMINLDCLKVQDQKTLVIQSSDFSIDTVKDAEEDSQNFDATTEETNAPPKCKIFEVNKSDNLQLSSDTDSKENLLHNNSIVPQESNELQTLEFSGLVSAISEDTSSQETRRTRRYSKRKRDEECCPVCGITLRVPELENHYNKEVENLSKIPKNSRKNRSEEKGISTTFVQVKSNRENRLAAKVATYSARAKSEVQCPVCSLRMTGLPEEINKHVVNCINEDENSDELVVVDDGNSFEEYEFADQTRVRAISFVPGGYRALQGHSSRHRSSDCDEDLNVDIDDTLTYGEPQYTELDVIHNTNDVTEVKELEQLRKAVLLDPTVQPQVLESRKWSKDNEGGETPAQSNSLVNEPDLTDKTKDVSEKKGGVSENVPSNHIISCLKEKIKDLEEQNRNVKCLICLEAYTKPVVSTTCWHVYCEECWLMTMGVKKLCPQCNMIVFPSDLRRIYL